MAIVRERTTHSPTVPADDLGLGIALAFDLAFDRTHTAHALFEFFLGVAIGFRDRLGRVTQVMAMAQLMGHPRSGVRHGVSDGGLAVTDGAYNGDTQRLLDLLDEGCQIVSGGRQEAFGQEDFARETIAQDP